MPCIGRCSFAWEFFPLAGIAKGVTREAPSLRELGCQQAQTSSECLCRAALWKCRCRNRAAVGALGKAAEKERTTCCTKSQIPWGRSSLVSIFKWHSFVNGIIVRGPLERKQMISKTICWQLRLECLSLSRALLLCHSFLLCPNSKVVVLSPSKYVKALVIVSTPRTRRRRQQPSAEWEILQNSFVLVKPAVLSVCDAKTRQFSQGLEAAWWHVFCPLWNPPRYFD